MSQHSLPLYLLESWLADAPLRIGLPIDTAAHGPELIVAAHLAIVRHHRLGGAPVRAIWCDDHRSADGGRDAARSLLGLGIRHVVGHFSSGAALAALPVYAEADAILIAPGSSAPALTETSAHVLRLCGRDDTQAETIADALLQAAPGGRVGIIGEDNGYGRGVSALLAAALDRRGITSRVTVVSEDDDASPRGDGPVVLAGRHEFAARLLRGIDRSRCRIVTDDALTPTFLRTAGNAAEGVFVVGFGDDGSPQTQALKEAYFGLQGETPGGYFLTSYVAVDLLLGALRSLGACGGAAIAAYLKSRIWPAELGALNFTTNGETEGLSWRLLRVVDGRFVST